MKIILRISIAILVIIAIPLIMALFIKKDYHIEREITINTPKQIVFDYIKYLKNQDNYSTWVMMDPNMKKTFTGTDGTVGFIYAWDGNKKAGKGAQEITHIIEGEKINIEVRFIKPMEGVAYTPFTLTPVADGHTRVKWDVMGTNKYPFNLMNLFCDKMMGPDMEKSLVRLKDILEKQ